MCLGTLYGEVGFDSFVFTFKGTCGLVCQLVSFHNLYRVNELVKEQEEQVANPLERDSSETWGCSGSSFGQEDSGSL